ncbi:hypothetical protein F909_00973 [Acinetobacter sp. ANC 3929]|nr:hypothetical protein F909_00973 [Acinetobacter sp. ANC 3929]
MGQEMQFLKDSFADKVRRGKIASPLKPSFSMEAWSEAEKITEFDNELYLAGMMFNLQFTAMRCHLEEIKNYDISLSNKDFLKIFCGISNRNLKILNDKVREMNIGEEKILLDVSMFSKKLNNNPMENPLSLEEISTATVDGVFYNILSRLEESESTSNDLYSDAQIARLINSEAYISQLYNTYENYWSSILYEQIKFTVTNGRILLESNPEIMIPYQISNARKTKNQIEDTIMLHDAIEYLLRNKDIVEYDGDIIKVNKYSKLSERKKNLISVMWLSFNDKIIDFLPKDLPGKSFTLTDLINLFIQLGSLGSDLLTLVPNDDEVKEEEFRKFIDFSPILNIKALVSVLVPVLNKDEKIVLEMLEFLTFTGKNTKGAPRQDLWRKPLIRVSDDDFICILEALTHPVGIRCVEGWLMECGVVLKDKGYGYEDYVKKTLKQALDSNKFINSYSFAEKETISVGKSKEEIDLLFMVDNLIVLGEAKCVVVSDSATSYWHCLEIIKKASEQSQRKIEFIKNNLEKVFDFLGWDYDADSNYIFQPVVIMSNYIGVGYSFFDVPVIDTTILNNYFYKNICPLISLDSEDHLVYLKLYNSNKELIDNFSEYINSPPSLESYKLFTSVVEAIPVMSPYENYEPTWQFKRIGIKEYELDTLLEHDFNFPLVITDKFYELERL